MGRPPRARGTAYPLGAARLGRQLGTQPQGATSFVPPPCHTLDHPTTLGEAVPERTLDVPEEKRRQSQGYHDLRTDPGGGRERCQQLVQIHEHRDMDQVQRVRPLAQPNERPSGETARAAVVSERSRDDADRCECYRSIPAASVRTRRRAAGRRGGPNEISAIGPVTESAPARVSHGWMARRQPSSSASAACRCRSSFAFARCSWDYPRQGAARSQA